MIWPSTLRVPAHTDKEVNRKIEQTTIEKIVSAALAGPAALDRRLAELEREWDIERTLEANAGFFSLLGLGLGRTVDRKWFLLPTVVAGFLFQHAVQGWCPPVPLFRRLGFRTRTEIDQERYALKALRGDFKNVPAITDGKLFAQIGALLQTVRR